MAGSGPKMPVQITETEHAAATPCVVEALAGCLAAAAPERFEDHRQFGKTGWLTRFRAPRSRWRRFAGPLMQSSASAYAGSGRRRIWAACGSSKARRLSVRWGSR